MTEHRLCRTPFSPCSSLCLNAVTTSPLSVTSVIDGDPMWLFIALITTSTVVHSKDDSVYGFVMERELQKVQNETQRFGRIEK